MCRSEVMARNDVALSIDMLVNGGIRKNTNTDVPTLVSEVHGKIKS